MKKTLLVVFFVILLFLGYGLLESYGLLERNATADIKPEVGIWHITLNDINIIEQKTITISDFIYEDNANIEDGYFAPGSVASYEIEINPNNTDVSIRYDIAADLATLVTYPSISFDAKVNGLSIANLNETFSDIISLNSIQNNEKVTIVLSLIWENDDTNNEIDSSLIDQELSIPITIKFSQYLGEDL